MPRPVIICVDDEKLVLDAIKEQLRRRFGGAFGVETVEQGEEALELLDALLAEGVEVPVVISDHLMPGLRGAELLARVHRRSPRTLTILLTGQADADAVGEAVNAANLYRYLGKPWREEDLVLTLREALRRHVQEAALEEKTRELERVNGELQAALAEVRGYRDRLEAENVYLREEVAEGHPGGEIVGRSAAIGRLLEQIEQVAPSDATVLVTGESGTGKELIARAVHARSGRAGRSMVRVNCAALPGSLIESELFGHERGAFSGATSRRVGRFELAHGSTLFLDEVGELPLELQAKLLRAIQEGEIERLGDARTIEVDVRVVAATNRDLRGEVERGRFREDLFYRLHVFPIQAPPLRERLEDVPLLVCHFVDRFAGRMGRRIDRIPGEVMEALCRHGWPGNVRELSNVIERAVVVSRGPVLTLGGPLGSAPARAAAPRANGEAVERLPTLLEVERDLIRQALERCNGVIGGKAGAARLLDVPASTLRARVRRHGLAGE